MSGKRARRLAALAVALVAAGWAWNVAQRRPLPVSGAAPAARPPVATGIVHVHTPASDGGGDAGEVIAAARAAGLDFVAISDHNNLDLKPLEGWHGELLVLVGTEISTQQGHVLGLGLERDPAFRFSGDATDALDDVRLLGGRSFAAHPTSPRTELRWTGPTLPGDWGLELLNGDTQWREAGFVRLARAGVVSLLNPREALLGSLSPPSRALLLWDRLLERRDVAGITGADAHSRVPITRRFALRFPSYTALFELARNHVLLERPLRPGDPDAGRRVVEALAAGRSWIGVDALAPSDGFGFWMEAPGERWEMGESLAPVPGLTAHLGGALPPGARLLLLRNGAPFATARGALSVGISEPGVYRAQVQVEGFDVPWVISNPLYVFDAATQARRRQRAAWPPPAPAPQSAEPLDGFEGPSGFGPELDPSSWMHTPVLDPGAGADGGGAARFSFRLGAPGPGRPYTWCALVERRERDLSGREGLAFQLRGDGVYRVWVQVRDHNPASADDGLEWWFASVRSAEEWQEVVLPFDSLRSINPASDGQLDLDAVRALVFVIDTGAARPGTEGTLWIDELRVF